MMRVCERCRPVCSFGLFSRPAALGAEPTNERQHSTSNRQTRPHLRLEARQDRSSDGYTTYVVDLTSQLAGQAGSGPPGLAALVDGLKPDKVEYTGAPPHRRRPQRRPTSQRAERAISPAGQATNCVVADLA